MTRVVADISVSLDGWVTGPRPGPDNGLGDGGEALHAWAFSEDPGDQRILSEGTSRSGAVVMGRTLFDVVDSPDGWDDETGYGAGEVGTPPFVVVTSSIPDRVRLVDLRWTFATAGLENALEDAKEQAQRESSARGEDLDVVLMGGGSLIGSALAAGLVDVLSLHLAPVLLGGGTPLFVDGTHRALRRTAAVTTSTATHLTYDVLTEPS